MQKQSNQRVLNAIEDNAKTSICFLSQCAFIWSSHRIDTFNIIVGCNLSSTQHVSRYKKFCGEFIFVWENKHFALGTKNDNRILLILVIEQLDEKNMYSADHRGLEKVPKRHLALFL